MNDFERIYNDWHEFAKNRDTARLFGLYDDNAVFESPLVPLIMQQQSGILRGKADILAFLEEGTRRRPNERVRWYRNGTHFTTGTRWFGNTRAKRPTAIKWIFWNSCRLPVEKLSITAFTGTGSARRC